MLLIEKVTIPAKYLDFKYFFLKKLAVELLKYSTINKHSMDLKPDKQLAYNPIYNLRPVKLKIFKTYIKIKIANNFI